MLSHRTTNTIAVVERSQAHPTRIPPIYRTPATPSRPRPLHNFTVTPPSTVTVLAARRLTTVASPQGNTTTGISIFTSTGFQSLSTSDYQTAVSTLKPDVAIPLADLTNSAKPPNPKRAARMADRTEDWLAQWFSAPQSSDTAIFAPALPIPYAMQREYLTRLSSDFASSVSGLAVYSADVIPDLSNHPELSSKPRLSLDPPATPHHVLRQIALGADVFLLPFLNSTSDSGVALTFQFPPPSSSSSTESARGSGSGTSPLLPLGQDLLSDPAFASRSTTPLHEGCGCYACATHHAAYVHHLLGAREMLGWTLLQIHNHCTAAAFFAGVRASLARGSFAEDCARFHAAYDAEVPAGTGERPRARGYHFKSEGGEGKRKRKAWGRLGSDGGEVGVVRGARIGELEMRLDRDLTETPVVPEGDAEELESGGFAEIEKK